MGKESTRAARAKETVAGQQLRAAADVLRAVRQVRRRWRAKLQLQGWAIAVAGGLAVFVDGEFWHGRKLGAERLAEMSAYWRGKIERNAARDVRVNMELLAEGWTVVRVTDRAIRDDLGRIGDFVERAAAGRFRGFRPPGVELHRP